MAGFGIGDQVECVKLPDEDFQVGLKYKIKEKIQGTPMIEKKFGKYKRLRPCETDSPLYFAGCFKKAKKEQENQESEDKQ